MNQSEQENAIFVFENLVIVYSLVSSMMLWCRIQGERCLHVNRPVSRKPLQSTVKESYCVRVLLSFS